MNYTNPSRRIALLLASLACIGAYSHTANAEGMTFRSVYNPTPESILKDPKYMTVEQFTAKAREGEQKGVYGSGKPIKLAFSQVVMNHPVRINMVNTFKSNCAKYSNVTCDVTEGNGEVGVEIANIESLIQRKPDVMILSSLSGTAVLSRRWP